MKTSDTTGWVMTAWGVRGAVKVDGQWFVSGLDPVPASRVFSTEAACIAGREPRTRKVKKTGRTRAEMTARED